jgi:hypothetical protein
LIYVPTPTPTPIPTVTVTTQVPTVPPIVLPSSSPSITDWLGGIGTVASVLLIGGALYFEIRRRRKDDRRRDAERRDEEMAQARLIHLTVVPSLDPPFQVTYEIANDVHFRYEKYST